MKKIIIGHVGHGVALASAIQCMLEKERDSVVLPYNAVMTPLNTIDNIKINYEREMIVSGQYVKEDFGFEKESIRSAQRRMERNSNPIKQKYQGRKNPFKK